MRARLITWCLNLLAAAIIAPGQVLCADLPDLGADAKPLKSAASHPHEASLEEISKKLDNPLSDLWLLWTQYDRMQFNGDASHEDRTIGVKYVEPVISIPLGNHWNLVNRPVLTHIDAEVPDLDFLEDAGSRFEGNFAGKNFGGAGFADIAEGILDKADWNGKSAWGDLIFLSMISPQEPVKLSDGKLTWGAGVTTMFPTASRDLFGTGKYSAGPAALALYMGPKWTFGALGQQWWSFAGDGDRSDVNQMNVQYFWSYNLGNLWQIGATPNITANWQADKGNRWTVPLGIGINKTVKIGRLPVRFGIEVHKTVVQPDTFGEDWAMRFVVIPVVPNMYKLYKGTLQLPEDG